ncbi:MAG: HAMP domain-containing histidine kinase [Caulobacter sp.]|nr:HAMP domain-containing histidine kinase [Caulobacter sp.]
MRPLASIRGRLLVSGAVFTVLAVTAAALTVQPALDRFVQRNLDTNLHTQITLLARAINPDGSIDPARIDEVGPFARHMGGWAWSITGPAGSLRSKTVERLDPSAPGARRTGRPPSDVDRRHAHDRRPSDRDAWRRRFRSGENESFYYRSLTVDTARGPVTISAGAPRFIRERMRDQGVRPLLLTLVVLGGGLLVAMLAQLELGLRPLRRLSQSLARVRAGEQLRIDGPQPAELRGVVAEVNALLDENEAALARARAHVSNLAHGLKTPLATLAVRLAEPGRDPDGALTALVAQIDGAIGHHLGRARAASPGAPGRPAIPVRERLQDLVAALARIHEACGVAAELDVPEDLRVTCDPQDFDEMVGNLLDNAWKWAAGRVWISGAREGARVRLYIDDDGPGLSEEAAVAAMVPGKRLDEQAQGHGFGLSIARELAELHNGGLTLARSPSGGLRAVLVLPHRSDTA